MVANMKVEIISRETIRPSSPTPPHLQCFKLSLLDQLVPTMYTPILLFYAADGSGNGNRAERSRVLRDSLSEFLTRYYPLAGRLNGNASVDCNDEGVYYSEARADFPLDHILKEPETETMKRLIPPEPAEQGREDPMFFVQVTFFNCGGMAVGVCISHKFSDAATMTTVISAWAASARGTVSPVVPHFTSALVFPPIDHLPAGRLPAESEQAGPRVVARRYVFSASKVALLKEMAVSEGVPRPSRVEAVSALIWKCTISALRSKMGFHRPQAVIWPVNLRARLLPPLPEYTFGNVAIPMVMVGQDESAGEIKLSKLVSIMRQGIGEIDKKYKRELGDEERVGTIFNSYTQIGKTMQKAAEMDFHGHTSWCRFPLYKADFGWGEPTWATVAYISMADTVVLMDAREAGGVEAWVSFKEEDMVFFERDPDLLAFASLNPSPLLK